MFVAIEVAGYYCMIKNVLYSILIICALAYSGCNQPGKFQSSHLAWIDSLKDPFESKVEDSLKYLLPVLRSVLVEDQRYRSNDDPTLFEKNKGLQKKSDSINCIRVTKILDRYGWMGMQKIGLVGNKAIQMTLIHAESSVQLKYYPVMIDGLRTGQADLSSIAQFEDRLNVNLNRKIYYGTQFISFEGNKIPYPLITPDSLEIRRKIMNLVPMELYMQSIYKTNWDVKSYSAILPELIKNHKITDSPSVHYDILKELKTKK